MVYLRLSGFRHFASATYLGRFCRQFTRYKVRLPFWDGWAIGERVVVLFISNNGWSGQVHYSPACPKQSINWNIAPTLFTIVVKEFLNVFLFFERFLFFILLKCYKTSLTLR